MAHEAGPRLLPHLDEPHFTDFLGNILLMKLLDDVFTGSLILDNDFRPDVHLQLVFGNVVN